VLPEKIFGVRIVGGCQEQSARHRADDSKTAHDTTEFSHSIDDFRQAYQTFG
jgi:hypothetical protein